MGTICGNGVNQPDLIAALSEIVSDWNATMAKLDADTGVTGTNYAALCNMAANAAVSGAQGISQDDIVAVLDDAITKINAANAKLDADTGVAGTDFAELWNVVDVVNVDTSVGKISGAGMYQGDMVKLLYTIKTNINGIQAKLDADGTVNSTNYAATNPIGFAIDISGC